MTPESRRQGSASRQRHRPVERASPPVVGSPWAILCWFGLLAGTALSACGDSGGVTPDGPALRIAEPTAFQFEVEQGRDAPTQLTRITNAGGGTLNWVASASDPWLKARPASGTLLKKASI